ncbi:MAG: TIGR03564 family F420-dependent LLM class oxidoreductase [Pseudomonadota bacterium]|nr:TIGR03564 family F420-dependent LLM class oxidoreductase [Pseudomonadota bacterium]
MKIGINGSGMVQKASVTAIAEHAATAAEQGFAHYWLAEHPTGGLDALTTLALVGQRVPDIELGTAIVPTFPRHPMALAGQALTVADAIGQRLTVGVGLSHEPMMAQLGIGFDRPIRHLREYLSILMPLLREGAANFNGELLSCDAQLFQRPQHDVPVLVAALGPQALAVAGEWAEGTTLAWVGPRTIREHIAPRLREAASEHQRPIPRIVATLPICVTEQPTTVRESIGKGLSLYGRLPSYRAMFEREGASGPADVAVVGSRTEVMDQIAALAEAGVTDFAPSEFCLNRDEWSATRALLVELATDFGH